ncbi:uncharacterized protein LAESUDRAFT_764507 [Laetiporus sulphureus 93-53]|uniref:Uncharacterized protein n=1 Tax=Laetiporus sulphureus 93-53 TaxID=1314785 RepID=A0A165BA40_9APHY|nr:uncharacterized protein LAESUDRAFT_764507 [Laetiporus sulphureus 93-53]KZT00600.1 hypothetical protein LAESUDRAFT_764507 [Laetiporus sulphureus 93-53]
MACARLGQWAQRVGEWTGGARIGRLAGEQRSLQDAFRDPSSPFHLPPGTQGPASPDPPAEFLHTEAQETRAEQARTKMLELGYDPSSFWEQRIVWGDHDAFQSVNP